VVEKAGAPDILVNNAAVTFSFSDFRHKTFLRWASFRQPLWRNRD
jgi:hypothetical protein